MNKNNISPYIMHITEVEALGLSVSGKRPKFIFFFFLKSEEKSGIHSLLLDVYTRMLGVVNFTISNTPGTSRYNNLVYEIRFPLFVLCRCPMGVEEYKHSVNPPFFSEITPTNSLDVRAGFRQVDKSYRDRRGIRL